MEIYINADVDLISSIALAWFFIGLAWLLLVLRISTRYQDDHEFISDKLGIVILTSVIGWPYNLFCWIFSWPGWLMPVSYFIDGIRPSEDGKLIMSLIIVLLLILNIAHVWLFEATLK